MAKEIKKSELKDLVEKGYKKKELAEHYGIPVMRMGAILKQAGLRIKGNRGETVVLVDDTEIDEITDLATTSVEEMQSINSYYEQEDLARQQFLENASSEEFDELYR